MAHKISWLLSLILLVPAGTHPRSDWLAAGTLNDSRTAAEGSLVIVGGGSTPQAVRERFLALAGGKKAHLVIIPTASARADSPALLRRFGYWKSKDVASCVLLHTRRREQANDLAFVRPLQEATGVWLSGGDQSKLVEAYGGTLVERELHEVLARGGVIGGTSAGAAVMSAIMITGGYPAAHVGTGFNFLSGVVVDTHFDRRHREPRLLGVLTTHPDCLGLGIDERTAVILHGPSLEVLGDRSVRLCLVGSKAADGQWLTLQRGDHANLAELLSKAASRTHGVGSPSRTPLPEAGSVSHVGHP